MQLKINDKEYDWDGQISATLTGLNKSSLKISGIYELNDKSSRKITTFPNYSKLELLNDNGEQVFLGVIKKSTPVNVGDEFASKPVKVEAFDYKEFLTNGELLSKAFKNVEPLDILNWVITSLPEGSEHFVLDSNISFGYTENIISWGIQDASPFDILKELAIRTNSKFWTRGKTIYFRKWDKVDVVDTLHIEHFETHMTISIDELINIELLDTSTFEYANKIILRSKNLFGTSPIIQNFDITNGQTQFTSKYNVGLINEAWLFDGITMKWKKLWVREKKWTSEPYNQFYEIQFTQGDTDLIYNEDLPPLKNTDKLWVSFNIQSNGVSIQEDFDETRRISSQTGYGSGVIPYYEDKDDITSQADLDRYCNSLLDKMRTPRVDYKIITGKDIGWKVAEKIIIDDEEFIVDTINIDGIVRIDKEILTYTYNITNTKNDTQKINFYDKKLKTSDTTLDVTSQEIITTNLGFELVSVKETTLPETTTLYINQPEKVVNWKLKSKDKIIYSGNHVITDLEKIYEIEMKVNYD